MNTTAPAEVESCVEEGEEQPEPMEHGDAGNLRPIPPDNPCALHLTLCCVPELRFLPRRRAVSARNKWGGAFQEDAPER